VEALAPAAPSADRAQAARLFLRRALAVHTVDEVAQELAQTLQTTLGAPRTATRSFGPGTTPPSV